MEANTTDTKQKILDTSERLFAEKGFDNTGIDEISREVGIAKSVIYYHFKSKKEILDTLFENFFHDLMERKKKTLETFITLKGEHKTLKELYRRLGGTLSKPNLRMLKILLMESIKRTDDVPLYKFWDINFDFLKTFYGDKMTDTAKRDIKDVMFESFFMMGLPLVSFYVFLQSYCRHYGINAEKAMEKMINITDSYFGERWINRIWKK